MSLSQEFPEIGRGTLSVPLLMAWGVETNLINRIFLAIRRVSGHPSGQQLYCSYICALVVTYPQLNMSYLSSFLDALLHVYNQSGFCLSVTASIQLYGEGGGRIMTTVRKRPLAVVQCFPTSYGYSAVIEDSVGSPETHLDTQITSVSSSVKMQRPQNLDK